MLFRSNLPRFGIEKPAKAGPGRPRLPDSVKERRKFLQRSVEEIAPAAIRVVNEILTAAKTSDKDRLRAAEIAMTYSVPKLEEVTVDEQRPLTDISDEQLKSVLGDVAAGTTPASHNGHTNGNGAAS